jgi:glycerol kinase
VAVAESIVFLIQANLDEMGKFTAPPEQIRITGGLAWDGLCQRIADLAGLAVYRPRLCEATGRGTAFLLAGRPGHWPEPEPGERFEPLPNPELQATYERWMELMLGEMRKGQGRVTRDE